MRLSVLFHCKAAAEVRFPLSAQFTYLQKLYALVVERQPQVVFIMSWLVSFIFAAEVECDGEVLVVYGCPHGD